METALMRRGCESSTHKPWIWAWSVSEECKTYLSAHNVAESSMVAFYVMIQNILRNLEGGQRGQDIWDETATSLMEQILNPFPNLCGLPTSCLPSYDCYLTIFNGVDDFIISCSYRQLVSLFRHLGKRKSQRISPQQEKSISNRRLVRAAYILKGFVVLLLIVQVVQQILTDLFHCGLSEEHVQSIHEQPYKRTLQMDLHWPRDPHRY